MPARWQMCGELSLVEGREYAVRENPWFYNAKPGGNDPQTNGSDCVPSMKFPEAILAGAVKQAEQSKPLVRAGALLRISRVQSVSDRDLARKTFRAALEEIEHIAGRDRGFFLQQARWLAAAVAPDLLASVPVGGGIGQFLALRNADKIGGIMLEHNHVEEAFSYVMGYDQSSQFPFHTALAVIERLDDGKRQLLLMRRAVEAAGTDFDDDFISLFQRQWRVLPEDEARTIDVYQASPPHLVKSFPCNALIVYDWTRDGKELITLEWDGGSYHRESVN
jgi:hypothetical protein